LFELLIPKGQTRQLRHLAPGLASHSDRRGGGRGAGCTVQRGAGCLGQRALLCLCATGRTNRGAPAMPSTPAKLATCVWCSMHSSSPAWLFLPACRPVSWSNGGPLEDGCRGARQPPATDP